MKWLPLLLVTLCFLSPTLPAFAEPAENPAITITESPFPSRIRQGFTEESFGLSHALSSYETPKYPAGFTHFDYVNPNAPKGGRLNLGYFLPFDTVHAFALKGTRAPGTYGTDNLYRKTATDITYDALMFPAADEAETLYPLIAESAEVAKDYSWVEFTLNPKARWHDHSPITVEDVLFTFRILPEKGDPAWKIAFAPIADIVQTGERKITFYFKMQNNRQLPLLVASIPILPHKVYEGENARAFNKSTLEPALASGPYRMVNVDAGRSVTYERVKDYWAKDLPVMRGQNNFDIIHFQTFRDSTVALEGIKAGRFDIREENISRNWATAYDTPAVREGRLIKKFIPHKIPTGNQAFIFQTERFPDRRVREAIGLAFDFDWTNRAIFYNAYTRNTSFFENTDFAAKDLPSEEELALLEPFREHLPEKLFTEPFRIPTTEQGKTTIRDNLLKAQKLLNEAGYVVGKDGWRVNKETGEPLVVEYLYYEPSFMRVFSPMMNNLKKLGIRSRVKIVEIAQYQELNDNKNFSVGIWWYNNGVFFPGLEQRSYWSCESAKQKATVNFGKICHPAVEALINRIENAQTLAELKTASRALDRVLLWEWYTIPQFHKAGYNLIYWDKFHQPDIAPSYDVGVSTWWAKDRSNLKAPPQPEETQEEPHG